MNNKVSLWQPDGLTVGKILVVVGLVILIWLTLTYEYEPVVERVTCPELGMAVTGKVAIERESEVVYGPVVQTDGTVEMEFTTRWVPTGFILVETSDDTSYRLPAGQCFIEEQ